MSRVGKLPIEIPSGVKAVIADGVVTIEGPKGKLQRSIKDSVEVLQQDGTLIVQLKKSGRQARADFGTTRSLINNMVKGVSEGWTRSLELVGVGFTAKLDGNTLTLATGYSHEVKLQVPQGVNCKVAKTKVDLDSCDKQAVGQLAARIRKVCPPEPYLGKGIKYSDENIRRKAGKAGK